jgi:hypothetical protein
MVEIDFQSETVENGAVLYFVARGVGRTKPNLIIVDEIRLNEDVLSGEIMLDLAIVVSFDDGEIVFGKLNLQGLEAVYLFAKRGINRVAVLYVGKNFVDMQRKKLVVELCEIDVFSVGERKVESDGVFWELERKGVEKEIFGGHKL